MSELLHPELISLVPFVGERIGQHTDHLACAAIDENQNGGENISIVIRTLNEAPRLEVFFDDINKQRFAHEVEVIVVDNESSDHTREVVVNNGAELVTISREDFTYPRSMNVGMRAANHDLTWLTVGHALPTTSALLLGGSRYFENPAVGGVFATHVTPNDNASMTERFNAINAAASLKKQGEVTKVGLGVMAATSAMLRKDVWRELGTFDERYQSGGEDTALAARMLSEGLKLYQEPLLSIHHSHGLSPLQSIRQLRGWLKTLRGPGQFDHQNIQAARPHINFD